MRILLLLLALLQPPDPHFTARWDTATSATIQWTQQQRGCLWREPQEGAAVFVNCYERYPATILVELGHAGPMDGALRPMAGDSYLLVTGGQSYRAPLRARDVFFPVWRGN